MGCVTKLVERFKGATWLVLLDNEFHLGEVAKLESRGGSIEKIFKIAVLYKLLLIQD